MSTQFSGFAKKLQAILDRHSETGVSPSAAAWGRTTDPTPKVDPATIWGRSSSSTGSSITDGTSNTAWGRPTPNDPAPSGTPSTAAAAWGRTTDHGSNADASTAGIAPLRTATLIARTDTDAQQVSDSDAAFDASGDSSKSLPLDDPFGNPLDTIDRPSVAAPTPIADAQPSQAAQPLHEAAKNLGLPADALQFAANGPLASTLMPGFLDRAADPAGRLTTIPPTGEPISIPFFGREPRPGSFDEVVTQKTGGGTLNSDSTHFFLRSDSSARSLLLDAEPASSSAAALGLPDGEFGQGETGVDVNLAKVPEPGVDDPFTTDGLGSIGEPETELVELAGADAIPALDDDAATEVATGPDAPFANLDM